MCYLVPGVYGPLVAGWLFVLVDMVTDHNLCKSNFANLALSSVGVWFVYGVLSGMKLKSWL
jgi:hypothetical protein